MVPHCGTVRDGKSVLWRFWSIGRATIWLTSLEVNPVTRCYKAEPWSLPSCIGFQKVWYTWQRRRTFPAPNAALQSMFAKLPVSSILCDRLLLPFLKTGSDPSPNQWTAIESRARQLNLFETAGNVCHPGYPLYLAQVVFFWACEDGIHRREKTMETYWIIYYMHFSECLGKAWSQTPY